MSRRFVLGCIGVLWGGTAMAGVPTWSAIASNTTWQLLTTKSHDAAGEVAVYNTTISDVQCFKGVATTDLAPAGLLAVVVDVAAAKYWSSAGVRDAEKLGGTGSNVDYYQYLDVPGWTLSSDRFWFLHGTVEKSGTTDIFHWDRLDAGGAYASRFAEVVAANPSAIEPPINVGGWTFKPTAEGTEVTYFVCTDVGGSIPRAVQNAATKGTLPDTVGDVIREARKRAGK